MEKPILLRKGEIDFKNIQSDSSMGKIREVALTLLRESVIESGDELNERELKYFNETLQDLKVFTDIDDLFKFIESYYEDDGPIGQGEKLRRKAFSAGFGGIVGDTPVIAVLSNKDQEAKLLHELQHIVDFATGAECDGYNSDNIKMRILRETTSLGTILMSLISILGITYSMSKEITFQNQFLYGFFLTTTVASALLATYERAKITSEYTNSQEEIRARETAKRVK